MAQTNIAKKLQQKYSNTRQAALTALLFAVVSTPAHASGDQTFQDGIDWLLNLMQGSMGGFIVLIAIVVAGIGMMFGGWKGLLAVVGIIACFIVIPAGVLALFSAGIPS
ncbi:TrbC/VirB2 family protein [Neisseria sp. S1]|uniref:TrbC/VirB2 family protein n=1 Tax=Neisseria sp. S1 TaxID=3318354 RepID=UPI003A8C8795